MLDEGVDMMFMDSAVKVGSQAPVKYDGNAISKPFNKYTQRFSFIRRQLNTDPEEGSTIAIGSQMVKIGFVLIMCTTELVKQFLDKNC